MYYDSGSELRMLELKYPGATGAYERYNLHARDLLDGGRYLEAEEILRTQAARRGGRDAETQFLLGRSLAESADGGTAGIEGRAILDDFIERFPADSRVPDAHGLAAASLARDGLHYDSIERYKKLLRMMPDADDADRGEIKFEIARGYYMADHFPAAGTALEDLRQEFGPATSIALDATILLAKMLAKYDQAEKAEAMLKELAENAPGTLQSSAALLMLARSSAERGDHERSIAYCERWFDESPEAGDRTEAMLMLARGRLGADSPEKTLELAVQVLADLNARDSRESSFARADSGKGGLLGEAGVLKAMAYEALGKPGRAESAYIEAFQMDPASPALWEAYRQLARLCEAKGGRLEAISYMRQATRNAPDMDILRIELAGLYRRNGDGRSAAAVLESFTHERALSPHADEAFMTLADINIEFGAPHEAFKALERYGTTGADSARKSDIFARQGDILKSVGLYEEAIEKYKMAIKDASDADALKLKIAETLLADGETRKCLDALARIKSDSPRSKFDLLDLKTRALMELGEYAEARLAIRRAIALRSGRESFFTMALLMRAELELGNEEAVSEICDLTLRLMEDADSPTSSSGGLSGDSLPDSSRELSGEELDAAPAESRRMIAAWADELYGRAEYGRAAKIYARVKAPAFPADEAAWALYQLGNCHFRAGEMELASQCYSRVAEEFVGSRWVRLARARGKLIEVGAGT
jgi:tetratricopeptide (TPR) repeat protein